MQNYLTEYQHFKIFMKKKVLKCFDFSKYATYLCFIKLIKQLNLYIMKNYVVELNGKYLTNHGGSKWWFIDSLELAYRFDNLKQAELMAKGHNANCVAI